MATYHAFPYGKMNQSFKFENEENQSLYEANLTKFKLLTASDFEFVNRSTLQTSSHKVGKTKTVEQRTGGLTMSSASYFKLDGKNCFDILEEKGFTFKIHVKLDILHPEFALIDNNGNQVAIYKMNVTGEREENVMGIGNKQKNIVITTDCEDLDAIFLGAFILSRVDFSLYLL
ncbi:MAG: hypothetical protein MJ080_00045 [Clostridia bacterium]|nr:hypothetical protein [Clostridia bacterium]